jgi:hypothetical protein
LPQVRNVQNAGGLGVVIVANDDKAFRMVGSPVDDIVIPSVSITRSFGDYIHQAASQAVLTATVSEFHCDDAKVGHTTLLNQPHLGSQEVVELACPSVSEPHEFYASNDAKSLSFDATDYAPSLDCGWVVTNDNSCADGFMGVVEATFTSFDTEHFHDTVTAFNGNSQYSPAVGTFSGHTDDAAVSR